MKFQTIPAESALSRYLAVEEKIKLNVRGLVEAERRAREKNLTPYDFARVIRPYYETQARLMDEREALLS
jgi:hypothetical protein